MAHDSVEKWQCCKAAVEHMHIRRRSFCTLGARFLQWPHQGA